MRLRPRPAVIVVNRGLWERLPDSDFIDLLNTCRRLQRTHRVRFVWRTTTLTQPLGRGAYGVPVLKREGYVAQAEKEVQLAHKYQLDTLDMHAVTAYLRDQSIQQRSNFADLFHDGTHFKEVLNGCFNMVLAELLDPRSPAWRRGVYADD